MFPQLRFHKLWSQEKLKREDGLTDPTDQTNDGPTDQTDQTDFGTDQTNLGTDQTNLGELWPTQNISKVLLFGQLDS